MTKVFCSAIAITLCVGAVPMTMGTRITAQAEGEAVYLEEVEGALTLGGSSNSVDLGEGDKGIQVTSTWVSNSGSRAAGVSFTETSVFDDSFTVMLHTKRPTQSNNNNKQGATFSVGTEDVHFSVGLSDGGGIYIKDPSQGKQLLTHSFASNPFVSDVWSAVTISYEEKEGMGYVSVYVDGIQVADAISIGGQISAQEGVTAFLGGSFFTGYMGYGYYNNVQVLDSALSKESIDAAVTEINGRVNGIITEISNLEITQVDAGTQTALQDYLAQNVSDSVGVEIVSYLAAVAGTKEYNAGIEGTFTVRIRLLGEGVASAAQEVSGVIKPTTFVNNYIPYDTFFGADAGTEGQGDIWVNTWLDTEGEHIQAHGGEVQWLDELDLNGDGVNEGGWIWYGEDKTRNGNPIDGIRCYTSPDLLNWTDQGTVLATHDVTPEQANADQTGIETNVDGLNDLKAWAKMSAPTDEVSQTDIDMAKEFIAAYDNGDGTYDEANLELAYKYLYTGYCIAERPKMLYNEKNDNYVLVWHVDGPTGSNILQYVLNGTSSSRYSRASMGFAVSDTPYGPFEVVNVQRMNYVEGYYDSSQGMARDMNVYLDKGNDIDQNGYDDAYAFYSSEENKHMYISLLNEDFTGSATEGTIDSMTLDSGDVIQTFQARALGDSTYREAPAIFKYDGYYYMITSGLTGWVANQATYLRAETIYGPWENMGDPCEGGSSNTFGSQSTGIIPVDEENGKFIYMGDRWSCASGTSALWDSSYVWLPININEEDHTISLPGVSNWSMNVFDEIEVTTELPELISSLDELPSTLSVTVNGVAKTSAVDWQEVGDDYYNMHTVTGVLTDLENRMVTHKVAIAPNDLVYFLDLGSNTIDNHEYFNLISVQEGFKNTSTLDQAYSSENGWGYVGDNTVARMNTGTIYDTLRYVNDSTNPNRDLVYRFDTLEEGTYDIYLGLYEPSSWDANNRIANISVKQDDETLASSQEDYGVSNVGEVVEYSDVLVSGTGNLTINLSPENTGQGSDMQISWIAIAKNEISEVTQEVSGTESSTLQPTLSEESIASLFTEAELRSGQDLKVALNVDLTAIEELTGTDQSAVEAALKEAGLTMGQVLDVTLTKTVGTTVEELTELSEPITITLTIPEELRGEGRTFSMVRLHNGVCVVLEDLDNDPNTVTYRTDRFSIYALAYQTTGTTAPDTTTPDTTTPETTTPETTTPDTTTPDTTTPETTPETTTPDTTTPETTTTDTHESSAPKTGDATNVGAIVGLFMASILGLGFLALYMERAKKKTI